MTLTVPPLLESALTEQAGLRGVDPAALALDILRKQLLPPARPVPADDWERGLLAAARDCGVSLPDSAVSSDGLYEIMTVLLDTSVLSRLANAADARHATATRAVLELHRLGNVLHITPQVLVEFRNVATRPVAVNGLGLAAADAEALAATYESRFPLLPETPDVYPAWKALVTAVGVIGKQVHDARLVAVCHVHGVSHVLTFNVGHFVRLAAAAPGVVVLDPASV